MSLGIWCVSLVWDDDMLFCMLDVATGMSPFPQLTLSPASTSPCQSPLPSSTSLSGLSILCFHFGDNKTATYWI